jgi:xylan 1,4-beta-xylosidase
MGSPQDPTDVQIRTLEEGGRLQTLEAPSQVTISGGKTALSFDLPRQGVSLVKLTW